MKKCVLLITLLAGITLNTQAGIIFSDNFDAGGVPADYGNYGVAAQGVLSVSGGKLRSTDSGNVRDVYVYKTLASAIVLQEGESLVFTGDITFVGTGPTASWLRHGLFFLDSSGNSVFDANGYSVNFNAGAAAGGADNVCFKKTAIPDNAAALQGTTLLQTATNDIFVDAGTTPYSFEYRLTRTGVDSAELTLILTKGATTVVSITSNADTSAIWNSINRVGIRADSASVAPAIIDFDNLQLELLTPPSVIFSDNFDAGGVPTDYGNYGVVGQGVLSVSGGQLRSTDSGNLRDVYVFKTLAAPVSLDVGQSLVFSGDITFVGTGPTDSWLRQGFFFLDESDYANVFDANGYSVNYNAGATNGGANNLSFRKTTNPDAAASLQGVTLTQTATNDIFVDAGTTQYSFEYTLTRTATDAATVGLTLTKGATTVVSLTSAADTSAIYTAIRRVGIRADSDSASPAIIDFDNLHLELVDTPISQLFTAYDGFSTSDYADDTILNSQNGGTVNGSPGFPREIVSGTAIKSVHSGGLSYGNLATTDGGTGDVFFDGINFSGGFTRNVFYSAGSPKPGWPDGTTLYASMLVRFGVPIPGAPVDPNFFGYDADGVDWTDGSNTGLFKVRNNSKTAFDQLNLEVNGTVVDTTTALDLTSIPTTLLLVYEITLNDDVAVDDTITVYINPSDLTDVPGTAEDTLTVSESGFGSNFTAGWTDPLAGIFFKSGMRDNALDEIRFAWGADATMADVLPLAFAPATVTVAANGADMEVTFDTMDDGLTYQLEKSTSLSGWTAVAGQSVVGDGSTGVVLTDTGAAPTTGQKVFYRIRVSL